MPVLTSQIVDDYLRPSPGDTILDVGCGDGELTRKLAARIGPTGSIVGLDASGRMIHAAKADAVSEGVKNVSFVVHDCSVPFVRGESTSNSAATTTTSTTATTGVVEPNSFDKVFSNAALHWITRNQPTRTIVFSSSFAALKPGGTLVFEMGGSGNVAEVYTAFVAVLTSKHGLSIAEAKEASPWFFPSEGWVKDTLTAVGFVVDRIETVYRPTKLTDNRDGGLTGWVKLFGAPFLVKLGPEKRDEAVADIVDLLEPVVKHDDGSTWVGCVRIRCLARKPESG